MLTLEYTVRDTKINPDNLRAKGEMPAVYYGKKQTATSISVNMTHFKKVWNEAGESTVVTLSHDGKTLDALIHDVDIDPVYDLPRHADFYVFEKGQKIEVEIPVEFTGVAPAVKDLGGILVKVTYELKVEAEPAKLPHKLIVDISSLTNLESVIIAREIPLPEGVTLVGNPEEVIASITVAKEEEEVTEPDDLSKIEVEKKGKEESAEGESSEESQDK